MDRKIVKLTNKPVSDKMQDILERLDRKENVPIEEIESTPEIRTARIFVPADRETIERRGREDMQAAVYDRIMAIGSAVKDGNDKAEYTGNIHQNARLDIVIGLSASGKSTALVDVLSEEFHSRVIDNDMAKAMIPEYNDGWGAGLVHKESQMISDLVFRTALDNHDNIVMPKVGSDPQWLLEDYIMPAKEAGYEVNLHFIDVDRNKAMGRMLGRFISKGRFLDPALIDKYAPTSEFNKVSISYETLKDNENISGSSKWNNDVEKGTKPVLMEYRNLSGDFISNARRKEGEFGYGQQNSTIDTGDNGVSRPGNAQECNVDGSSQERVGQSYNRGQEQDNECTVSYGAHRGTTENIKGSGFIRDVGTAGEISLTDEDLKGIPVGDDMKL